MAIAFEPALYGPVLGPLVDVDRLRPLGPGSSDEALRGRLSSLTAESAFVNARVADAAMASACLAAVWLVHDFLDESHEISQQIGSTTGSYWHGIMHRREGDSSNAKYWFRRVGDHALFERLQIDAAELAAASQEPAASKIAAGRRWDPFLFVDLCQEQVTGRPTSERLCRQIAKREWELLFDYCYRRAIGEA